MPLLHPFRVAAPNHFLLIERFLSSPLIATKIFGLMLP